MILMHFLSGWDLLTSRNLSITIGAFAVPHYTRLSIQKLVRINSITKMCADFYQKGNCKFAKSCQNDHPKFCQKFKNFGLKKFNSKGCELAAQVKLTEMWKAVHT